MSKPWEVVLLRAESEHDLWIMIDVRDELNGQPGMDTGPYRTLTERISTPRGALIYQTNDLASIAKVREEAIALFTAKYRASVEKHKASQ